MSSVRKSLVDALNYSFQRAVMFSVWTPAFPVLQRVALFTPIEEIADKILENYTERDVAVALAKFRLEGKWEPE